jgi:NTP pyrophosphatase (non-canonical NTP hydrolase)
MNGPHMQRLAQEAIALLVNLVHRDWCVPKGWWNDIHTGEYLGCNYVGPDGKPSGEKPKGSKSYGDINSLIGTELSEAYEGFRKDAMSDKIPEFTAVEEELADALIRIVDAAGGMNLRLAEAFVAKMAYNHHRPDHEVANRKLEGGKKT